MGLDINASLKQALDAIEQKTTELETKKDLIATVISKKGIPTQGSDTLNTMADNIKNIETDLPVSEGNEAVVKDLNGDIYDIKEIKKINNYSTNTIWGKKEHLFTISDVLIDNSGYLLSSDHGDSTHGAILLRTSPDGSSSRILYEDSTSKGNISSIATNTLGDFYVGFMTTGRILKLSSTGKVVKTIVAPEVDSIDGMVCDRFGGVYIVVGKTLAKYDKDLNLIWKYTDFSHVAEGLAIDSSSGGDYIYVATLGGQLYKFMTEGSGSSETVKRVWDRSWIPNYIYSVVADSEENIYVGDSSGNVAKYSAQGKFIWGYPIASEGIRSIILSKNKDYIYLGEDGGLVHKINLDGELIWTHKVSLGRGKARVTVDGEDNVYIGCSETIMRIEQEVSSVDLSATLVKR